MRRANRRGVSKEQYPSLERLHAKVMSEQGIPRVDPIPPMTVRVFRNILLHMGIRFQRRNKSADPLLTDDPRILRLRETYFHMLFEAEASGAIIFYMAGLFFRYFGQITNTFSQKPHQSHYFVVIQCPSSPKAIKTKVSRTVRT